MWVLGAFMTLYSSGAAPATGVPGAQDNNDPWLFAAQTDQGTVQQPISTAPPTHELGATVSLGWSSRPNQTYSMRSYRRRPMCLYVEGGQSCWELAYVNQLRADREGNISFDWSTSGERVTTWRVCLGDWRACRDGDNYYEFQIVYPRLPCRQGFVWREAFEGDYVCVTPEVREQAARDNAQRDARRSPNGGAYGYYTCRQGYVWREAGTYDSVCVAPSVRDQAASDNSQAENRWQR